LTIELAVTPDETVWIASLNRTRAEDYFRNDMGRRDMRNLRIVNSTDQLRGQEGTGKTLHMIGGTFCHRENIAGSIAYLAKVQRFTLKVIA